MFLPRCLLTNVNPSPPVEFLAPPPPASGREDSLIQASSSEDSTWPSGAREGLGPSTPVRSMERIKSFCAGHLSFYF